MRNAGKSLEVKTKVIDENYYSKEYYFGLKRSNYYNYRLMGNPFCWIPEKRIVKKYAKGGKLLDVGCALGYFTKKVGRFVEVYGIDISDYAVSESCRINKSKNFYKIDIENESLPFKEQFFDMITAFDILEHTKSVRKSMETLTKYLKPKGYLYITLPLEWENKKDRDISHQDVPTMEETIKYLNDLGYEIIEIKRYFEFLRIRIPWNVTEYTILAQKK